MKQWYFDLEQSDEKCIELSSSRYIEWFQKLQQEFKSSRVTDSELCATLQQIYSTYHYFADPHTGVAFCAAKKLGCIQFGKKGAREENSSPSSLSGPTTAGGTDTNDENHAVVIMSTASPCKFEEAVTIALGADCWKEYAETEFPKRAYATMQKPEKEPIAYHASEGMSVEDTQRAWEKSTKQIIEQL